MNEVIIKTLTRDRLREYRNLRFEAIACEPLAFGTTLKEEENLSDEEVLEGHFIENGLDTILYAEINGSIVGMIRICKRRSWLFKAHARFRFFFVQPKFQGNKIGYRLMLSAIEYVKELNTIRKADLGVVITQKKAIAMYERFGFQITRRGKTVRYYDGVRYENRLMTLYL